MSSHWSPPQCNRLCAHLKLVLKAGQKRPGSGALCGMTAAGAGKTCRALVGKIQETINRLPDAPTPGAGILPQRAIHLLSRKFEGYPKSRSVSQEQVHIPRGDLRLRPIEPWLVQI